MEKKCILILAVSLALVLFLLVAPALAGPGGFIAKTLFKSFWGKVLLLILTIFFLPLIIYVLIREKLAERRTRRDLGYMAKHHPEFEWLRIRERALDCFHRVHGAWRREDVSEAAEYMTAWYWQNQQLVHLDRWEREGLKNHCEVNKVADIQPILFVHRNDGQAHENSVLVLSITAVMRDYLARRSTGEVVEGDKSLQRVETIWSFTMVDGKWRVSNIEEDIFSLEYAKLASGLPRIEETILPPIQRR